MKLFDYQILKITILEYADGFERFSRVVTHYFINKFLLNVALIQYETS